MYFKVFDQITQSVSREDIIAKLNCRGSSYNCLPIEYLCRLNIKEDCILIKKFISISNNIDDIKNLKLKRVLIAKVILFGDEELNELCDHYIKNPQNLILQDEKNQEEFSFSMDAPPQSICSSVERVKKFLKFCDAFPKEMNIDDLFYITSLPFSMQEIVKHIFEHNDQDLFKLWLSFCKKMKNVDTVRMPILSSLKECSKLNESFLKKLLEDEWMLSEKFRKEGQWILKQLLSSCCDSQSPLTPKILELFLDAYWDGSLDGVVDLEQKSEMCQITICPSLYQLMNDFTDHTVKNTAAYAVEIKKDKRNPSKHYKFEAIEGSKHRYVQIYGANGCSLKAGIFTPKKIKAIIESAQQEQQNKIQFKKSAVLNKTKLEEYNNFILKGKNNRGAPKNENFFLKGIEIRNGFDKKQIISPIWAMKVYKEQKWEVYVVNFDSGEIEIEVFQHDEDLIPKVTNRIERHLATFNQRKEFIIKKIPQAQIEGPGLKTTIPESESLIPLTFSGLPSEEDIQSYCEMCEERTKYLPYINSNDFHIKVWQDFPFCPDLKTILLDAHSCQKPGVIQKPYFAEIVISPTSLPLKVFFYPNFTKTLFSPSNTIQNFQRSECFISLCEAKTEIKPFIDEMNCIMDAAINYNINTTKFKEVKLYEQKYKDSLNIPQEEIFAFYFANLYETVFKKTLDTMKKFIVVEDNFGIGIFYFEKRMFDILISDFKIPIEYRTSHGISINNFTATYPSNHLAKEIFKSFFVPLLIQTMIQKCTMANSMEIEEESKEYHALMNHFINNLIAYDLYYDQGLINIKKEREKEVNIYEGRLWEANRKLNEYLTSPIYIQLNNLQMLPDKLSKAISEVATKILMLRTEYEKIEEDLMRPSGEYQSLKHEKRKYALITSSLEGLDKNILLAQQEELRSEIKDLQKTETWLKNSQRDAQHSIEKAKTGTCSHYYTLQSEIEQIKNEKEILLIEVATPARRPPGIAARRFRPCREMDAAAGTGAGQNRQHRRGAPRLDGLARNHRTHPPETRA